MKDEQLKAIWKQHMGSIVCGDDEMQVLRDVATTAAQVPNRGSGWETVILDAGDIANALVKADTFEEARNYIVDAALAKIK